MEPLDQEVADACAEPGSGLRDGPARILVVATKRQTTDALLSILETRRHRCQLAPRLEEARAVVARSRFDLVLLDRQLPDGDGLDLTPIIQKTSPSTKTILLAESATLDSAVDAVRRGVIDVVRLPGDLDRVGERVDQALVRSRAEQQRDERLARLKRICHKLNTARHEVSQQVDTLCNDLVSAYQDVAEQMNEVAMASEFRTLLKQELDVEDLLRTMLEYLLTKTGPTNAAVFLPDSHGQFGLGAYVNYDCPRETISMLLDHLCEAICPQMAEERQIVAFEDAGEFAEWIGFDTGLLGESQVLAFSCRHHGECLAVIVLFRSKRDGFGEELGATIEVLRPIFAEQVANVIRVHHRAAPSWPRDAADDECDFNDDFGFGAGKAA
jgi:DNA-binding response OmpR family regulator